MTTHQDLLIEIGTEELPPKALLRLRDAFAQGVLTGLGKQSLSFGDSEAFASPRRLAILIKSVELSQADKEVERRGPAIKAAFDTNGIPSKATEGFARSCGTTVDQLQTLETDKGSWLVYRANQKGKSTAELIPQIIEIRSMHCRFPNACAGVIWMLNSFAQYIGY